MSVYAFFSTCLTHVRYRKPHVCEASTLRTKQAEIGRVRIQAR